MFFGLLATSSDGSSLRQGYGPASARTLAPADEGFANDDLRLTRALCERGAATLPAAARLVGGQVIFGSERGCVPQSGISRSTWTKRETPSSAGVLAESRSFTLQRLVERSM